MDRLLPDSMTSRLLDLWSREGDEFMKNYWLMGNPFSMITAVLCIFATILIVGPMLSSKNRDLRPLMLIMNGTVFGIIGMGFMLGLALTRMGTDCFRCDGSLPQDTDLRTAALKMIAFMYVMTKLLEFQRPIFASFRNKTTPDHNRSLLYTCYLFGQLFMSYIGGVFYPAGPLVLWPFCDAVVMIFDYGYMVLRLTTPELHPRPVWKKVIAGLRLASSIVIMVHSYIFASKCAGTSGKIEYLLTISYYYSATLVTAQLSVLLMKPAEQDAFGTIRQTVTKTSSESNNNIATAVQGHKRCS